MSHAAVCVAFGSLMVQRDQWDTTGAKKILIGVEERQVHGGRPVNLSIPAKGLLGSPMVTIHVQAPTACAGAKHFWPISLSSPILA